PPFRAGSCPEHGLPLDDGERWLSSSKLAFAGSLGGLGLLFLLPHLALLPMHIRDGGLGGVAAVEHLGAGLVHQSQQPDQGVIRGRQAVEKFAAVVLTTKACIWIRSGCRVGLIGFNIWPAL